MGRYDNLIPADTNNQQGAPNTSPTVSNNRYANLIPEKAKPVEVPKTEKKGFFSAFKNAISGKETPTPSPQIVVSEKQKAVIDSNNRYAHLVKTTPTQYFSAATDTGGTIGLSETEKDPSGRPYLAYRNKGDTSTTTDYTRVATPFDPRKPQKVTRDSFYNPRAVENRQAIKEAMGGSYSDELDHRIALALSGSNNPKNLKPIPGSENQSYSDDERRLQLEVINGKKSLFDAQLELAQLKGLDTPWTPDKKAKSASFQDFINSLSNAYKPAIQGAVNTIDAGVNNALLKIDSLTSRPTEAVAPYFEPRKKNESSSSYQARLSLYESSPEYKTYQKNLNQGLFKRTLKELPSKFVENPAVPGGIITKSLRDNSTLGQFGFDKKAAAKELAFATVRVPTQIALDMTVTPVLNVYGAIADAASSKKAAGQVGFQVPGTKLVISNRQWSAARRIENGENVALVTTEEGFNSVLDSLFLVGAIKSAFMPRQIVTNKMTGDLNKTVGPSNILPKTADSKPVFDVGPKSFREYKKPVATTFLPPDAIAKAESQGFNFGPKFDPSRPTFFRMTASGKGGGVIGEVVQLKPSLFNMLSTKFSKPAQNIKYYETAVKNSEAINIDKAIQDGDVPKSLVYQEGKGKVLTTEFATGRVNDIAQKLDMYRPGLGDTFKKTVDINNSTMNSLVAQGEAVLNASGVTKIPPTQAVKDAMIATEIAKIKNPKSIEVVTTEERNIDDVINTVGNASKLPAEQSFAQNQADMPKSQETVQNTNLSRNRYANLIPKKIEGVTTADKITKSESKDLNVLKDTYKKLGTGDTGLSIADEALGEILVSLDLSQKGSRLMMPGKDNIGYEFKAIPSTFPSWIPENLRNRKAIDRLLSNIQSIDTILYPTNKSATAQRAFVDALLDQVDKRLGVDTKELRTNIINIYEKPITSIAKTSTRSIPKGAGGSDKGAEITYEPTSDSIDVDEVASRFQKISGSKNDELSKEAKKYKSAEEFIKAQGDPVYHATLATFDTFNAKKAGSNSGWSNAKFGTFFLDDKVTASEFPEMTRAIGDKRPVRVIEAYIDLKNPIDLTLEGIFTKKDQAPTIVKILAGEKMTPEEALVYLDDNIGLGDIGDLKDSLYSDIDNKRVIQKAGYDGIISDYGDGIIEKVVFDTNQITTKADLKAIWKAAHTETSKSQKTKPLESSLYTARGKLDFNTTTDEISKELAKIFDPNELTVRFKSKISAGEGSYAAGEYVRMKSLDNEKPRSYIDLLTINGKIAKDTAMHEAFHAYFNMFENKSFRQAMLNRVKKLYPFILTGKYQGYETRDIRAEEWLADDFADWHNSKFGGPKYTGFFARVWERLVLFFKELKRKIIKADKLYEDIMSKRRKYKESTEPINRRQALQGDSIEALKRKVEEAQRKINERGIKEYRQREASDKPYELPVVETYFESLKSAMNPLRAVDFETRDILRKWNTEIIKGRERVNREVIDIAREIPKGIEIINDYESGKSEKFNVIKMIFDDLQKEANDRGLEVGYVENYIPHVYANSPKEQEKIILNYLESRGLSTEEAVAYMNEKPLTIEQSRRLKLKPNFEKDRIFDTYAEAAQFGLKPKYENISDLVGYYIAEMEKSIAGRKLIDSLETAGKIKPEVSAPISWSLLNPQFSPLSTYKAPAPLAKAINGIFPDTYAQGLFAKTMSLTAGLSKKLQEITLSAGVPVSNLNYFSVGQLIKEITAGNFKAVVPFIRANSNNLSLRYFEEKAPIIRLMADQGIDLSGRIGSFGERSYSQLAKNKEFKALLGKGFDDAFNKKTFASFMPQLYIQVFDNVYNKAKLKDISQNEAARLAGDVVKNSFGLLSDNFARSKVVKDTLSTVFFAPQFREGIIRTLAKTGHAGWDFRKGANSDKAYRRNLALLAGMTLTFLLYQIINKETSGTYTWENPEGRKFAIRIPTESGTTLYIEFMPSFFAFPRMLGTGLMATAQGDFKMATQKFGGLLSAPIKLVTDVIGNEDYFGRPIYDDRDDTATKAGKIAAYLGLNANHPYVRELINLSTGKTPLYQAITAMLEIPIKFGSLDKESKASFYKEQRKKQVEENKEKIKFQDSFNELQTLIESGNVTEARSRINALSPKEYSIYKSMKSTLKRKEAMSKRGKGYTIYTEVQKLVDSGDMAGATNYVNALSQEDYNAYKAVRNTLE